NGNNQDWPIEHPYRRSHAIAIGGNSTAGAPRLVGHVKNVQIDNNVTHYGDVLRNCTVFVEDLVVTSPLTDMTGDAVVLVGDSEVFVDKLTTTGCGLRSETTGNLPGWMYVSKANVDGPLLLTSYGDGQNVISDSTFRSY